MTKTPIEPEMKFTAPRFPLSEEVRQKLGDALEMCPDVAFAHLVEVDVPVRGESGPALFVWLRGGSLRSLRAALNLVSEAVSRVLPKDRFIDVVILNSAPELLLPVEAAECLLVEPCPEERRRALSAARSPEAETESLEDTVKRWWWPFS